MPKDPNMSPEGGYNPVGDVRTGRPPLAREVYNLKEHAGSESTIPDFFPMGANESEGGAREEIQQGRFEPSGPLEQRETAPAASSTEMFQSRKSAMTLDRTDSVPSTASDAPKRKSSKKTSSLRKLSAKENGVRRAAKRTSKGNGRNGNDFLAQSKDYVLHGSKRMIDKSSEWTDYARKSLPGLSKAVRWPRTHDYPVLAEVNPLILGAVGLGLSLAFWKWAHWSKAGDTSAIRRKSPKRTRRSAGR